MAIVIDVHPWSGLGAFRPKHTLPAQIPLDSAYSILYVSSAFILLSATLGVVFVSLMGSAVTEFQEYWTLN